VLTLVSSGPCRAQLGSDERMGHPGKDTDSRLKAQERGSLFPDQLLRSNHYLMK